jgi:hypothetical protein
MRPDLEAAQRLAARLPSRTHEGIFYHHKQGSKAVPQIIIGRRKFRSRLEARRILGIGSNTLNDWLRTGKAKFA